MAKFEIWLEMNLRTIDSGAATQKVTLEGPDGNTWGTWPRDFPEMSQSITGILAALREELPKGKHGAKLFAWAADGTQLSCFPLTLCGSSDAATEGAQNRLIAERANAMFLSNVEKQNAGMIAMMKHTADVAEHLIEANRALNADAERWKTEREESRIRILREEGKQQRLNELTNRIMPLVELALGVIAERAASLLENSQQKPQVGPVGTAPTALPPSKATETTQPTGVAVDSVDASGEQGTTTPSHEPDCPPDIGCNPPPREPETHGEGRSSASGESPAGRDSRKGSASGRRKERKPT